MWGIGGWWNSGTVGQRDWGVGRLPAVRLPLTAVRLLPAVHSHLERKRRISVRVVSRENDGKYRSAGRRQTIRQSDVRRRRSLSTVHRHPERQRRISVRVVSRENDGKYRSAGRRQTIRQSDVRRRRSLSTVHRHPERQRRISVRVVSRENDGKYRSVERRQTIRRQTAQELWENGKW